MLRPDPRSASIGSVRVASHAGTAPKTMPVTSARPKANASTSGDGERADRQECGAREREREQQPRGADGDQQPGDAAGDREQDALDQRLRRRSARRDAPIASRTAVWLRRATPRASSRFATFAHAISSTSPQTPSSICRLRAVLLLHHADTGTGRHDGDGLLWQHPDDVGHPVRGIARVVFDPLAQHAGQPRRHAVDRGPGLQPADHAQPGARSAAGAASSPPAIIGSCCSGIQRSGGSPRSVSPKKPGGATPTTVNGCPSMTKRGADDRRIAAVRAPARRDG